MKPDVAVVGAGWAGLSCAHHLQTAGANVHLFEAAPIAGGRARTASIRLAGQPVALDNGQHMMIGAYRETLALIDLCQRRGALRRLPLQFESPRLGIRRRGAGRAGLVWGFLTARGLNMGARIALARLGVKLVAQRWRGFDGLTVESLLNETGQSEAMVRDFWQPLCVAAFNTDIDTACAQTFVNVLHDALFQSADGSDFLVATISLGDLLPAPLINRLRTAGVQWHCPARVSAIEASQPTADNRWLVHARTKQYSVNAVVLATPVQITANLLAPIKPAIADTLHRFRFEPIRTVYLAWSDAQRVTLPALQMLNEDPARGWHGQWLFDRGHIPGNNQHAAVVISVAASLPLDNVALAQAVGSQLTDQLGLPEPIDSYCITEKRATFVCTPDRPVVTAKTVNGATLPEGLVLAGDYCVHRYPATLESAVISGRLAAEQVMAISRLS